MSSRLGVSAVKAPWGTHCKEIPFPKQHSQTPSCLAWHQRIKGHFFLSEWILRVVHGNSVTCCTSRLPALSHFTSLHRASVLAEARPKASRAGCSQPPKPPQTRAGPFSRARPRGYTLALSAPPPPPLPWLMAALNERSQGRLRIYECAGEEGRDIM